MPVNWQNAERLLTAIDTHEGGVDLDMSTWDCGTARCVAGWAVHLLGLNIHNLNADEICEAAGDYLGIEDPSNRTKIFSCCSFSTYYPSTADIRARLKELDTDAS